MEQKPKSKLKRNIFLGVAGGLTTVLGMCSVTTVSAGNVGVLDRLGTVYENELQPGIQFKNPFARAVEMETRTREYFADNMNVQTKGGLTATIDIAAQYHIMPDKADVIYTTLGAEYEEKGIVSPMRHVVRDVIASHAPEDLYGDNRESIGLEIEASLKNNLFARGIVLERIYLKDATLPDPVTNAINKKVESQQGAEQMKYVLQKETAEAERRTIEAGGIAKSQEIIAGSLSPEYLQWRYITTLESLATSPNNTFVITPYDQHLLPMLPLENKK